MSSFMFITPVLAPSKLRRVSRTFVALLLLSFVFVAFSPIAQAQSVELDSGILDHDKIVGPRWIRVNFSPLIEGDHDIRVTSDSSADVRFSVFRIVDAPSPNNKIRIGTSVNTATLAEWTGVLDISEQYYLGIWSTSGSGSYTATLEAEALAELEIASQPTNLTVTEGDDATFTVAASGNGTLTYQWFENDQAIAGAMSDTLVVLSTSTGDDGNVYRVDISDDNGTLSSDNATLIVDALAVLTIVSQPTDLTVTEGEGASFTVAASGSGTLSYQWYENNLAIAGATTATYTAISTSTNDDGNLYRVDVSDDNGTLSSGNAMLSVDALAVLTIVSQPTDLIVTEGEGAAFTVAATGSGTLSYQWYLNNLAIAGATSDTYLVNSTLIGDNGNLYRVDISDDNGTLSSDAATLTVDALVLLEIASQPTNLTVTEGEDASFTVVATGDGALSYQWYVNDQVIVGATSDTYVVLFTNTIDNGDAYRVDITDANATLSSDNATLEVLEVVVPTTVLNLGQGVVDSSKVTGPKLVRLDFTSLSAASHVIQVAWDSDADVKFRVYEADGTLISSTVRGANPGLWSGELALNSQYYITLWSSSGVANYDATIEANIPISIESQPFNRVVTEGEDVTFNVEATGSGTLSNQWFANGNPLLGETGDSLTIFATSLAENGIAYNVEVSNGFETVASDIATLTVNEPLVLGLFSQEADNSAWMLDGPAPTLDVDAGVNTNAWGEVLLRIGDVLLVGGDFQGIKPARNASPTARPFLAALNAVSGQPVTTFQVPVEVDDVVRALALSPNGEQIYVGGDFGLLVLDATTGALDFAVSVTRGANAGRVFDIAVTDSQLYIGGDFYRVNNVYRANIARLSLSGQLDTAWRPKVTHGYRNGNAAPVQSIAVSPTEDVVYIGGNFQFINDTPVLTTPQSARISILSVSALDGSVLPERFFPDVGNNSKGLTAHDIVVTEFYVIIAWGGPNYLSFHSLDGSRLLQYAAKGDVQALEIVGNHVFVGHHGEYFGSSQNPIPQEAVVSLEPRILLPFKLHSFRIDDPSFLPEQAWQISGTFGVWGIAAAEDSIWVAGQMFQAGSNDRPVDGLVRFPAL